MSEKEFFDWLRSQQKNKRLTQEMVDGANELLALMTAEELQQSLIKLNNWQAQNNGAGMQLSEKGFD